MSCLWSMYSSMDSLLYANVNILKGLAMVIYNFICY